MSGTPIPYITPPQKQADQKFCHACGMILHISADSCVACGARQFQAGGMPAAGGSVLAMRSFPNHQFCRGCGLPLHRSAPLCPHCGAPQSQPHFESEKSRVAAALLALILGGFGAHKFYLGETGLGVLYLLFCWTFIPAIAGLIEGIIYLSMSDERFGRKYD